MYKQLIIVRRDLNMSPGKLAAQVSHASMAFLTTAIKRNSIPAEGADYHPAIDYTTGEYMKYLRDDLRQWAKEAVMRGETCFYTRPVDSKKPCGDLQLCDPITEYRTKLIFDKDLFEQWIDGSFTKIICGARDKKRLIDAIVVAEELGWQEGVDYFLIRDNCLTELEPEDEDGRTITCLGFRPMEAEQIDKIGKKYHLL